MPPSHSMILSTDGKPLDMNTKFDITDKSISQLREMGFETLFDQNIVNSARHRRMAPAIPVEEQHCMEMAL